MSDTPMTDADNMLKLPGLESATVSPAVAVGAIALNFAMKYHDINTVQDGALYQQYKLEGKNMTTLQLDMVFETAARIEAHLMASSDRIAAIVFEAVMSGADEHSAGDPHAE